MKLRCGRLSWTPCPALDTTLNRRRTDWSRLKNIQHGRYDLLTLDIRMPYMDGMAVLRAVRERLPEFPVIVVTGLASDEEISAARELGVFSCIRKPFEVSQLIAEVRKALGE